MYGVIGMCCVLVVVVTHMLVKRNKRRSAAGCDFQIVTVISGQVGNQNLRDAAVSENVLRMRYVRSSEGQTCCGCMADSGDANWIFSHDGVAWPP